VLQGRHRNLDRGRECIRCLGSGPHSNGQMVIEFTPKAVDNRCRNGRMGHGILLLHYGPTSNIGIKTERYCVT
jgi:hypothetical protein